MDRILPYWKKIIFVVFLLGFVPFSVYLVGQRIGLFTRAFGNTANLIVDNSASFETTDVWRNLAQGGESKERFLADIAASVRALKPEYIRIDHIFDFYDVLKKDSSGRTIYDFSKLDQIVSDIESTGAKPFFSLSYMPPIIAVKGDNTQIPNDWNEWERLVSATVAHYSSRISDVYYEVWNEPDLFGNFKTYGSKNYFDLYYHSVLGAKSAGSVLPYKIGGPATTALYKNWFTTFLKFVADNNLPLDFYSWHHYSTSLDDFEGDYNNIQKWLVDFPNFTNLELMITEAGPDSKNSDSYDNVFGAIHTFGVSAVLQGKVSRVFSFEIKDGVGPKQFWGRWGIFTNDKFGAPVAKPRYTALAFLNAMTGRRINVAGQGTWVKAFAKDDNGTLKTLIVNYDPYGQHYENVPIKFINLKSQNFTYKRLNFLGGERTIEVATNSATWQTLESFAPNSAALIQIIPKQ